MTISFTQEGSLYYYIPNGLTGKTCCFDLDWTLTYGAKKLFPSEITDIHFLPGRLSKLQFLAKKGWSFVIFTNLS